MNAAAARRCPMPQAGLAYGLAFIGAVLSVGISCRSRELPKAASSSDRAIADAASATGDDLPAARQFAAWLAAFNSVNRATMLAFHEKNFPYAVASDDVIDIDHELALSESTGGFDLKKSEQSTATQFVALLGERDSGRFARASMDVEAAEPHRVQHFVIQPIPTPPEFQPVRLTESDAIAALRSEIAEAVGGDRFSGAVLVAKNGSPIFAEAYGWADREHKIANGMETPFRIGSMNKMFTAVAVLQLVQSGGPSA